MLGFEKNPPKSWLKKRWPFVVLGIIGLIASVPFGLFFPIIMANAVTALIGVGFISATIGIALFFVVNDLITFFLHRKNVHPTVDDAHKLVQKLDDNVLNPNNSSLTKVLDRLGSSENDNKVDQTQNDENYNSDGNDKISQGANNIQHLQLPDRPDWLKKQIDRDFEVITKEESNKYYISHYTSNGQENYNIMGINNYELVKNIIRNAMKEGKNPVNIVDIGGGNGQWCENMASLIEKDADIPMDVKINFFNLTGHKYKKEDINLSKFDQNELKSFKREIQLFDPKKLDQNDKRLCPCYILSYKANTPHALYYYNPWEPIKLKLVNIPGDKIKPLKELESILDDQDVVALNSDTLNKIATITGQERKKTVDIHYLEAFKIEEFIEEFKQQRIKHGTIDLAVSHYTFGYFKDPVGTFQQIYNSLTPDTGLILTDQLSVAYQKNNSQSADTIKELLLAMEIPFAVKERGNGERAIGYLIQRDHDMAEIPLTYVENSVPLSRHCLMNKKNEIEFAAKVEKSSMTHKEENGYTSYGKFNQKILADKGEYHDPNKCLAQALFPNSSSWSLLQNLGGSVACWHA